MHAQHSCQPAGCKGFTSKHLLVNGLHNFPNDGRNAGCMRTVISRAFFVSGFGKKVAMQKS